MSYLAVKSLHLLAAAVTVSGFILRGYWMMIRSGILRHRLVRIVPHVIDTVFLLSGIALVLMSSLNTFTQPWLLAKFSGLLVYIALGSVALKRGPTMRIRVIALTVALFVFVYIVGVALSKSPASFLGKL